jgi:hypothetical protein
VDTKQITVVERYTTTLTVSKDFRLVEGEDAIRSLLTSTIPDEGCDQVESLLMITDLDTLEQVHFDKENL